MDGNLPSSKQPMSPVRRRGTPALLLWAVVAHSASASIEDDRSAIAALDTRYQAAVEQNDADTMARIHDDHMILVLSNGAVQTGAFLEQRARDKTLAWEHQVEVDNSQVVRVSGDTAVVTAKLWLKATRANGAPIDFQLWFSDTYVRTANGWRYFFGQAGAPLQSTRPPPVAGM